MSDIETQRTLLAPAFLPVEDEAPEHPAETEHLADHAPAPSEAVPPGAPLADVLADGLARRGWHVDYRWTTFDSHAFDARRTDNRYDVEVKLLDGPHEEGRGLWRITAKRRTGFFARWWPGRSDPAEHALLRRHIDEALAADGRVAEGGDWTPDAM
jgi:hypothetical protein